MESRGNSVFRKNDHHAALTEPNITHACARTHATGKPTETDIKTTSKTS